jgi:large subunit ribosomal protein L18
MKKLVQKNKRRYKRKLKIRCIIKGSPDRPRLSVFKSNKHFYAQVIDDTKGITIASISDVEKGVKDAKASLAGAKVLGTELGKRLKDKKVKTIVFDRNGFTYHGLIKEFADAVREAGIAF